MIKSLISVPDKRYLKKFANDLSSLGIEMIATEGTAREISRNGIQVSHVSELTGFSEMLGGRIKTLHPEVHAAIATGEVGIVVVNLIPMSSIASMDIGGVALLKSAIKNFRNVAAVTDPDQYGGVIKEIRDTGGVSPETRLDLAIRASACIVEYESKAGKLLEALRS
ncbi:MAG: phosphoribosylaminoimidazolecarboxamide formyltransferase [Euryarchaeota archaeon]|nr:phosphoribosylaminoimidazolecarboxamide formyltransferase [Euryarchaeota archaeon]